FYVDGFSKAGEAILKWLRGEEYSAILLYLKESIVPSPGIHGWGIEKRTQLVSRIVVGFVLVRCSGVRSFRDGKAIRKTSCVVFFCLNRKEDAARFRRRPVGLGLVCSIAKRAASSFPSGARVAGDGKPVRKEKTMTRRYLVGPVSPERACNWDEH